MVKEKFRNWNFRGNLNVKYIDGSGIKQVWTINQDFLLVKITSIVSNYQNQGITLTNRQLYYQLVAGDVIPNADEIYKRICKFLTDSRYAGLIDWSAIEDRGRTPEKHSEWENVKDLIASAVSSYRLPRWKDQEFYVELYTEKQAMESVLKPVANKFHIYFGCNKGYSSASTMYDLAKRVLEQIENGKKVKILYFGDHDSSGIDMLRDIKERIVEFLLQSEDSDFYGIRVSPYDENNMFEEYYVNEDNIDEYFEVVPIALTMQQIKKYNPPPNPAKITDPRAKGYIEKYGNSSWELDALKPEILIQLAENGILDYLDYEKYRAWIDLEKKQKKELEEFGKKLDEQGDKNDQMV